MGKYFGSTWYFPMYYITKMNGFCSSPLEDCVVKVVVVVVVVRTV